MRRVDHLQAVRLTAYLIGSVTVKVSGANVTTPQKAPTTPEEKQAEHKVGRCVTCPDHLIYDTVITGWPSLIY